MSNRLLLAWSRVMLRSILSVALIIAACSLSSCKKRSGERGGDSAEYTIRFKKLGKGDVQIDTDSATVTRSGTLRPPGGGEQKLKPLTAESYFEFRLERLEQPEFAERPTKAVVLFTKYNDPMMFARTKDELLRDKRIMMTRTAEKYAFTSMDAFALRGEELEVLNKLFNISERVKNEDLLPANAVRVGEEWRPNVARIAAEFSEWHGFRVDASKSNATGQLLRVFDKGDKKYGEIEYRLDFVLDGNVGKGPNLEPDSKVTGTLTVTGCIDGTLYDEKSVLDIGLRARMKGTQGDLDQTIQFRGEHYSREVQPQ